MNGYASIPDIQQNPTEPKAAEGNICILAHAAEGSDFHAAQERLFLASHQGGPSPVWLPALPLGCHPPQGTALQRNTRRVS